jgi:hypothetical protein
MPQLIRLAGGEEEPLTITQAELGQIITRYRHERINNLPLPYQNDSSSVWISKEKLEDFFESNPDATGMRLYFGVIDDPEVPAGIHNLIFISTIGREDQISEDSAVIVTKNYAVSPMGSLDAVICPPPQTHCTGRAFV